MERLLSALGGVAGLARIPQGDDLEAGDVVVGVSRGRGNPHLAIYEGGGFLWHMSSTGPRAGWCRRHKDVAERAWDVAAVFRPMEAAGDE